MVRCSVTLLYVMQYHLSDYKILFIFISPCGAAARAAFGVIYFDHYDFICVREKMAEGTPDDFYLVETIVATVHNERIPKLVEVMESIRALNLERFDSEALRLEEDVRRTAQQLRVYCQRVSLEWNFHSMRGHFNMLWSRLRRNFREFCAHCLYLGISVSHTQFVTLSDDEPFANEEGDEPPVFYYL